MTYSIFKQREQQYMSVCLLIYMWGSHGKKATSKNDRKGSNIVLIQLTTFPKGGEKAVKKA